MRRYLIILLIINLLSCHKEEEQHQVDVKVESAVSYIDSSSAKITVFVLSKFGHGIEKIGLIDSDGQITIPEISVNNEVGGTFIFDLTDLQELTAYKFMPFAIAQDTYFYGNQIQFITGKTDFCDLTNTESFFYNLDVSEVTDSSAKITFEIDLPGDYKFKQVGLIPGNPYSNPISGLNSNFQSFVFNLTNLSASTNYNFKAFCLVDDCTIYSDSIGFVTNEAPVIGPAGGYVVYDDGNGGGLEAFPFVLAASFGCPGSIILGTNDSDGAQNTDTIAAQCSDQNCASWIAKNYSYGGYSDWYVPAKSQLYDIKMAGDFPNWDDYQFYMSSTQSNATNYATYNFATMQPININKGSIQHLILVRDF